MKDKIFFLLKRPLFFLSLICFLIISKHSMASRGDTTWVTTFNQNFQNWADVHYGTFVLPDTTTHFKQILMYYTIGCPSAGCDPWDRLGWVKLYKDSLTNYEIARVITPYNIVGGGYPGQCVFVMDVTDYMPLLHDTVRLGSYIESWIGGTRGWLVTIKFAFIEGEIQNKPYKVVNLWQHSHVVYGDPSDPPEIYLPPRTILIDPDITKAKVKVMNTGHGQGNTDNAAEFSVKIHTLTIGNNSFDHVLWRADCSVNPCSPQGGTWQFARAGWCPGASVIPWEVDATSHVTPGQNATIDYNLQAYENFCRPNNPNCISGQTCADCNYNNTGHTPPHYTIHSQLILYKLNPFSNIEIISSEIPSTHKLYQNFPNPFNNQTNINFELPVGSIVTLKLYNVLGREVKTLINEFFNSGKYNYHLQLPELPSGIYYYSLEAENFSDVRKLILLK